MPGKMRSMSATWKPSSWEFGFRAEAGEISEHRSGRRFDYAAAITAPPRAAIARVGAGSGGRIDMAIATERTHIGLSAKVWMLKSPFLCEAVDDAVDDRYASPPRCQLPVPSS